MIMRYALVAVAASACAVPAHPAENPTALAEKRLRGCIQSGASTAPKTDLRSAVIYVRAFCKPKIDDLAGLRIGAAVEGTGGEVRKQIERKARRELNDEIVRAVANFTGLTS